MKYLIGAATLGMLLAFSGCGEKEPSPDMPTFHSAFIDAQKLPQVSIENDKDTPDGYYDRGLYYIQHYKFEQAADQFRKCLADNPAHAGAYNGLGSCYLYYNQDYTQAANNYALALRSNPDPKIALDANIGLGFCYLKFGLRAQHLEDNPALLQAMQGEETRMRSSAEYFHLADAHFLAAKKLQPDFRKLDFWRGNVALARRDYDGAIKQYQGFLGSLGEQELEWRGLTYEAVATAYEHKKDYMKAIEYQELYFSTFPKDTMTEEYNLKKVEIEVKIRSLEQQMLDDAEHRRK